MAKKYNITIALILLSGNVYFLYITFFTLFTRGGTWGFGTFVLPFTFLTHLFILPSALTLKKKNHENPFYILINTIGIAYFLLLGLLFLF